MIRKILLSLSAVSAITLVAGTSMAHAIEMQGRTVCANCKLNAAISIVGIGTSERGYMEGDWDTNVLVPVVIYTPIPVQRDLMVSSVDTQYKLNEWPPTRC